MARWKAHGRLSIRVNWTFSLSVTVPELWGEMCTARLFHRGGPLCTQILPEQGRPPSTIRKLETLGYQMVKTASLCVPSFWHNTGLWGADRQTNGRICRRIYSALALRLAVNITMYVVRQVPHRPTPQRFITPDHANGDSSLRLVPHRHIPLIGVCPHHITLPPQCLGLSAYSRTLMHRWIVVFVGNTLAISDSQCCHA